VARRRDGEPFGVPLGFSDDPDGMYDAMNDEREWTLWVVEQTASRDELAVLHKLHLDMWRIYGARVCREPGYPDLMTRIGQLQATLTPAPVDDTPF